MRLEQIQRLRMHAGHAPGDVPGPRYLLVVGRHINCPAHDAPSGHDAVEIADIAELLMYLVENVNEICVRAVYCLDPDRPDLSVTEIYGGRHAVDGLRVDFATPEETAHFLGPWTWTARDGFTDCAGLAVDAEALAAHIQGFCGRAGAEISDPWQPMETAPKDGTVILFQEDYVQKGEVKAAYPSTCWWDTSIFKSGVWELTHAGHNAEDGSCEPKRWMPLPKSWLRNVK